MPSIAIDPGLVGVSYQAPMTLQDAENAINYYIEVAEVDGAKMPVALLGTPGKNPVVSTQTGPVRGVWVLPGGTSALAAVSSALYLISVAALATQTTIATFSVVQVGTLLTNFGPVVMRDNGVLTENAGGVCFIVDGLYWYYYNLSGIPNTFSFQAIPTSGSNVLSFPLTDTLGYGLIIAATATLTDANGYIPSGTYISSVNYATPSLTISEAATGSAPLGETVTLSVAAFGQILDPGALPADRLAFIQGWVLANQSGTRNTFCSGPSPYFNLFPPLYFAPKQSSSDNLVTLIENNTEAWLIGERTSEVWYNSQTAAQVNPFQPVPGVAPQIGCGAKHSITRLGPMVAWLGRNEQGENIIVSSQGYNWQRLSNHAVEHAISSYPYVADCIGFAYEEEGHLFGVWTFPTADATWVYDATASGLMGKPCWHQRASFDPVAGVYHRDRANCFMNMQDLRLVGDYQTGQIHQMSRSVYTDAGNPLRAQRRCKHIWKKADRTRVRQSSLQIEFTPGVGVQQGQGQSPQCMLRWSDDGGFTWSNEHWRSIGAAGMTLNRAKWNRLGGPRDRVFEVNFSDPTPRDIIGATLFGEAEDG
jgi:hypothetical protein